MVRIGVAVAAVAAVEAGLEQKQEGLVSGYKRTGGLLVAVGNAAEKCSAMPLLQHLRFPCASKLARNHDHHHGKERETYAST